MARLGLLIVAEEEIALATATDDKVLSD
jgi:hypothetical protein